MAKISDSLTIYDPQGPRSPGSLKEEGQCQLFLTRSSRARRDVLLAPCPTSHSQPRAGVGVGGTTPCTASTRDLAALQRGRRGRSGFGGSEPRESSGERRGGADRVCPRQSAGTGPMGAELRGRWRCQTRVAAADT